MMNIIIESLSTNPHKGLWQQTNRSFGQCDDQSQLLLTIMDALMATSAVLMSLSKGDLSTPKQADLHCIESLCMPMQMDFEGQWAMLMGILPDGAGAADMLCRILVAIDEDIVSLDIPRSPDGIKASMEFKVNGHVITMHMCVTSRTFLLALLLW